MAENYTQPVAQAANDAQDTERRELTIKFDKGVWIKLPVGDLASKKSQADAKGFKPVTAAQEEELPFR